MKKITKSFGYDRVFGQFAKQEVSSSSAGRLGVLATCTRGRVRWKGWKTTPTLTQTYTPPYTHTPQDVFKSTVGPMVDEALAGMSCTAFAYGQTGTGKTHTMEGQLSDPKQYGA